MAYISFTNMSFDYVIMEGDRSLKNKLFFSGVIGGTLGRNTSGQLRVSVFNNLSLEIKDGERVGLLGHNGSGKSTLLRLMAGIYFPTSGNVVIRGKTAPLLDMVSGMQSDATGLENIYLRGAMLGMTREQIAAREKEIIEFSELGDFIHLPVKNYSQGMYTRLAFSITTSIQPEILLIDEGIGAGDEAFQHKAAKRITNLVQSSNILVFASHSQALLDQYCNRIIVLKKGKVDAIQ